MSLSSDFIQIYLFVLGLGLLLYFVLRKTFIFSFTRDKNNSAPRRFIYTVWVLFLILAWIVSVMVVVIHVVYSMFFSLSCVLFFVASLYIMIFFIYQGIKHRRIELALADGVTVSAEEIDESASEDD